MVSPSLFTRQQQLRAECFCDPAPLSFTVRLGDEAEQVQVLYSRGTDQFYQLQMSANENSVFVDRQIMQEVRLYLITRYNPSFFLIPILQHASKARGPVFQSRQQLFESATEDQHLQSLLLNSPRVRAALESLCELKQVQMSTGAEAETYYSFDLQAKVMPLLLEKYRQVRKHLAVRHASTAPQMGPGIIKQEQKGAVKSEQVKTEPTQDASIFEGLFCKEASGYICDELPLSLQQQFLAHIAENDKDYAFQNAEL